MNLKKINNKTIGLLFSISLIIPPNYGLDLNGLNYEDLPVIFLFGILFYRRVTNFSITTFDRAYLIFITIFVLYSQVFTKNFELFNQTNMRFIFYFTLSYLCIDILKSSNKGVLEIFEPLGIVMIANLIIVLFQIQLPGTIDGWILNNSGSINPLTSGRLGGFQGGGPNVIGIICAIYALVCLFKITSSINFFSYLMSDKLNTTLLIISLFNLYITFSRGSYIALFIGSLVLLFYTDLFTKNSKILIFLLITISAGSIIYIFPSIFLKQSNRSFLNNLAINNIELFEGAGGGNYIKEVYKDYLITLNDDELFEKFNIQYSQTIKNTYMKPEIVASEEETDGYLKLKFDHKDGLLPRSVISFYHSSNGREWLQIGSNHTSGLIIDLIENDAFFEVGGWGDGQSPGESYLDGYIKKVQISTNDDSYEYILTKENRDKKYFIYLPKTNSFYDNRNDGKIIFSDDGIKLKRPRSYWIAIPNQTNISKKDFEIVIQLKLNNIPKGNETLFSQSSIINTSKLINNQSWKWSIIDGRMYFFWIEDIVSGYSNYLGGQSLRSGKLISSDGKFDSIVSEFSLSQYDEITTSHNGFLTMGVEYGLFPVLLIICSIVFSIYRNLSSKNQLELCLLIALLTQNLTNDLIYSPDVAIYFWIIPTYLLSNLFKD